MKKKPLDLAKRRLGFPGGSVVKNPPADAGQEDPSGEGNPLKEQATHSSILAWKIPRTEESGRL